MSRLYALHMRFGGTRPQVSKIVKALSSKYRLIGNSNLITAPFESERNIEAAEYSRDLMNAIIENGGFICSAYLRRCDPNAATDNNYVADWEYDICKGYYGEPADGDLPDERLYGLDLKRKD